MRTAQKRSGRRLLCTFSAISVGVRLTGHSPRTTGRQAGRVLNCAARKLILAIPNVVVPILAHLGQGHGSRICLRPAMRVYLSRSALHHTQGCICMLRRKKLPDLGLRQKVRLSAFYFYFRRRFLDPQPFAPCHLGCCGLWKTPQPFGPELDQ